MITGRIHRMLEPHFDRWLHRRLPAADVIHLSNKRLFIFPTRAGFSWMVLLILCWLVATNYENNIVFAFACLLTSVFIVSILATYANLSGITIRYLKSSPVFAGDNALVELAVSQPKKRSRQSLQLGFKDQDPITIALDDVENLRASVPLQTVERGWLNSDWLRIESTYPLGLLRVWSHLDLGAQCLVYPKPIADTPATTVKIGKGDGPAAAGEGSEEFVGLNTYRQGDSLKRVAWKQFARGQGMHVKHYADSQSEELWIDWGAFPGKEREARLSRMCDWLIKVSNSPEHQDYGLRLPGLFIKPSQGETHRQHLLQQLALFERPAQSSVKASIKAPIKVTANNPVPDQSGNSA